MKISLSPQRRNGSLSVVKDGDKLRINGELFDFSPLPDGAAIEAGIVPCEWIVGPVQRVNGSLSLTLILPHGPSPSLQVAFPQPLIDPPDGLLPIPADVPISQEVSDVEG